MGYKALLDALPSRKLRLITYVVNLTETFSYDIEREGHVRSFEVSGTRNEEAAGDEERYLWAGWDCLEDIDLDEFTVLAKIFY